MSNDLETAVRKVVKKVLQTEDIDENAKFAEVYQLDSLSTLELIAELENETNIRIPNEAVLKITSFKEAISVLRELQLKTA